MYISSQPAVMCHVYTAAAAPLAACATLIGQEQSAIRGHAMLAAPNTDSATMAPASASRDGTANTAPYVSTCPASRDGTANTVPYVNTCPASRDGMANTAPYVSICLCIQGWNGKHCTIREYLPLHLGMERQTLRHTWAPAPAFFSM